MSEECMKNSSKRRMKKCGKKNGETQNKILFSCHSWKIFYFILLLFICIIVMPSRRKEKQILIQKDLVKKHNRLPFNCSKATNRYAYRNNQYKGLKTRIMIGSMVVLGPDVNDCTRLIVRGVANKGLNGPILSTKGFILRSPDSKTNYTMVGLKYKLNYSALKFNESVESDICVVILPNEMTNSLSSGSEVLCAHEHVHYGLNPEMTVLSFPNGGFVLKPGWRIDVNSVSSVWGPNSVGIYHATDNLAKRIEGLVTQSSPFLSVTYEIELVVSDVNMKPPLSSVRSPQRDRSFNLDPFGYYFSPFTQYQNIGNNPIEIVSFGVFLSVLDHYSRMVSMVEVLVDNQLKLTRCLSDHIFDHTTSITSELIPLNFILKPGSIITVRHRGSGDTAIADVAFYIIFSGNASSLIPYNEYQLLPGVIDLNRDNYVDFVDVDTENIVWAELTTQSGAHDTQHVLLPRLPKQLNLGSPSVNVSYPRFENDKQPYIQIRDIESNVCINLFKTRSYRLTMRYCNDTFPKTGDCWTAECRGAWENEPARPVERSHLYDDFSGNGWVDRIRVETDSRSSAHVFFAQGKNDTLFSEQRWFISNCCRGSNLSFHDRGFINSFFDHQNGRAFAVFNWGCSGSNF